MKKSTRRNTSRSRSSSVALATALLASTSDGLPSPAPVTPRADRQRQAQPAPEASPARSVPSFLKFAEKFKQVDAKCSIVGMNDGHTVYRNGRGEYFYVDPSTGDMKFLSSDVYLKMTAIDRSKVSPSKPLHMTKIKFTDLATIVGVDERGNTVQKNARGEMFYLDPATGDMVFVKR